LLSIRFDVDSILGGLRSSKAKRRSANANIPREIWK
jgi:hypothetical protein